MAVNIVESSRDGRTTLDADNPRHKGRRMSDDDRPLEDRFRQVLCEMEMVAGGSITNYSPTGAGGVADSKPPPGARLDGGSEMPMHVYWRGRWNRAFSDEAREAVIKAAEKDLDSYRKNARDQKVSGESMGDLETRIVKKCREGWTVEEVATHCRCNTKLVRSAWLRASIIPDEEKKPSKFQRARVKQLARQGMSEREVADMTKLSKTTVRRLLERAA